MKIEGTGKRLAMVEAKMVLDTLAELQYDAEVETLREILVRVAWSGSEFVFVSIDSPPPPLRDIALRILVMC